MFTMKRILLITLSIFTHSLNARVPASGMSFNHPMAGTPLQVQQAYEQQEQPSRSKKQPKREQPAETKASLLNDMPDAVAYRPIMQNEHMAYEPAESFPLPNRADLAIAKIEELKIDPKVKRQIKRIVKQGLKEQRDAHKTPEDIRLEILANQRVIIGLLSVLVAKLVIWDLYNERVLNNETK